MNGPMLTILMILLGVLTFVITIMFFHWIVMRREQRRVEDLVELRGRQGAGSASGVDSNAATAAAPVEREEREGTVGVGGGWEEVATVGSGHKGNRAWFAKKKGSKQQVEV